MFKKIRRFQEGDGGWGEGGRDIELSEELKVRTSAALQSFSLLRLPQESKSPTLLLVAQLLNPKIIIYSRYNCRQVFQRLNPPSK